MIYPEVFPPDRKNEHAEEKVFTHLKKVADQYDIFYSRRFVTDGLGKKPEYEIDFIVAVPERVIVCLEVKAGLISYSGQADQWTQNGKIMFKRPDSQATGAAHALAKQFSELIAGAPVGWGLCFPDCDLSTSGASTTGINSNQVIGQLELMHLDHALPQLFEFIKQQYPPRTGVKRWQYEKFKNILLRGLGFVQVLGNRIKYDEERFVQLTNHQLELFKRVSNNKKIITSGPAGSGKTIVAKTIAQDFLNSDKTVLFLCFNRTLANKIRYEFDRYEDRVEVTTFHSLSRRIIDQYDQEWWENNSKNSSDEFWNLDVPVKLEECIQFVEEQYDCLIIDEGQDFKEFWFELVFRLTHDDGHKLIFLDQMQNIFGHYTEVPTDGFLHYGLPENCRNTKEIVNYLSGLVGSQISSFENAPKGEVIIEKNFESGEKLIDYMDAELKELINNHDVNKDQILLLVNSTKSESSLYNVDSLAGSPIKSIDNKGRFDRNSINYTTINTFKGLEADIVFVVDTNLIEENKKLEKLYTEASRARHKLYLLSA